MKRTISIFGALLLAVVITSCQKGRRYEQVDGDPLHARIYTLDNGLKVYMSVNREVPRVQARIAVRVGGKNDPAETTGLAHYFEHLMFKGTQQVGTSDYAAEKPMLDRIEELFETYRKTDDEQERAAIYRVIDSVSYEASRIAIPNEYDKLMAAIGADGSNAYTGYDETVYLEDIPSNEVENWLKIQADRFQNMVIRGFHTELETIYEEKNMSLTRDDRKVYEKILAALFPHHPYGTQTVLGTQDHLKNPSIANVKRYKETYYVPNNMAICLAGDFDPEETIAMIDRYFGPMQPNEALPRYEIVPEEPIVTPVVECVYGPNAENVTLAWRLGGIASRDNLLSMLAAGILSNGQAGLFDLDLNQSQKVLGAYGYPIMMTDYGAFVVQGFPKEGQTLDQVKELMLAEVSKLRNGAFDERLLRATVNNFKATLMKQLDSNEGRVDAFVSSFIGGTDWKDEVRMLEALEKVTAEEVAAFVRERLGEENFAVVYKYRGDDPGVQKIGKPAITPILTNRNMQSDFLTRIQEAPVKPIEPRFVDFERDLVRMTSRSGAEVLYKKNETNGLFELTYLFDTGSDTDPLLRYAFDYLDYLGTDRKSVEEIKREFYDIACSVSTKVTGRRSYVVISGLNENLVRAMELFEELITSAQPDEEVLESLKADIIKSRADAKHNQAANFAALQRYVFFGKDYVKASTLTDQQLRTLTSTELLAEIKDLFSRNHRILYYGPSSRKELLNAVNRCHTAAVGNLNPVDEVMAAVYRETPTNSVILAPYDANQLYLMLYSNRGEHYDPKNDARLTLYNAYFGGGMNGIVFQEMREARGLAYSAGASLRFPDYKRDPYTFRAFIATQNDKMGEALDTFLDIIENMPESETAFRIAKESLAARLRTRRTTKSDVLWSYVDACDLGIDYDRDEAIYRELPGLTLNDVKAVQQEWVQGRNYTCAILGDTKTLVKKRLAAFGKVTIVSRERIFGY